MENWDMGQGYSLSIPSLGKKRFIMQSNKNLQQEILAEMHKIFLPEGVKFEVGDFISPTIDMYSVLSQIKQSAIEEFHERDPDGPIETAIDYFHENMLEFANSLLADDPVLYAYASSIVGFIANDGCSSAFLDRIDAFFVRMGKKFREHEEVEGIEDMVFEAYYCPARLTPFESYFCRELHDAVHELLYEYFNEDKSVYRAKLLSCMEYASSFVSGESLLIVNFEAIMDQLDEKNREESSSDEDIRANLVVSCEVSSNLAMRLEAGTALAEYAIARFSKNWDALFYIQQSHATGLLTSCQEVCKHPAANPRFKEVLQQKVEFVERQSINVANRFVEGVRLAHTEPATAQRPLSGKTGITPAQSRIASPR